MTPAARREVRNFGVLLFVVAGLFLLRALWRHTPLRAPGIAAGGGAALLLASLLAPGLVRPLERAWFRLGRALGRVTTPVLLVALFALVVVPLRALAWLFRYDPLGTRRDPSAQSYWIERAQTKFTPSDFERLS